MLNPVGLAPLTPRPGPSSTRSRCPQKSDQPCPSRTRWSCRSGARADRSGLQGDAVVMDVYAGPRTCILLILTTGLSASDCQPRFCRTRPIASSAPGAARQWPVSSQAPCSRRSMVRVIFLRSIRPTGWSLQCGQRLKDNGFAAHSALTAGNTQWQLSGTALKCRNDRNWGALPTWRAEPLGPSAPRNRPTVFVHHSDAAELFASWRDEASSSTVMHLLDRCRSHR